MKKYFLSVLFSLIYLFTIGQVNQPFIDYLSKNNFKREQMAYINNLSTQTSIDTICYLKAKYYLQYFNDSLFFSNYLNCQTTFAKDSNTFNKASILFLKKDITFQSKWFGTIDPEGAPFISKSIYSTYYAGISPLNVNVENLPEPLQKDFLNYRKIYLKKPFVGAALSFVVPGLGKLYAGRPRSFITTLFTHVIYGAESYECIHKLGIKNAFTIFSLSFFSVFYVANVYSGYHDVNEVKKEIRNQFLINAYNYYNFNYSSGSN